MYDVIVLKEGYCRLGEDGKSQNCGGSVTLIKGKKNVLVDTGSPRDRDSLLSGLKGNGLIPDDIHYVVGTHGHIDHIGNLNLFPNAVQIVSNDICHGENYLLHDFKLGIPYEIDEHIDVISTPGHTGSDVSVLVKKSPFGTVLVAGDLFECAEDLEEPDLWQRNSENGEVQEQSRINVLKVADHIVPGHGSMFKVPDEYKSHFRCVMYYEEINSDHMFSASSSIEYTVVECD
ncbi:hypothetical protein LOTGIDRAFT_237140 [Lottia gigantea]|uniref:Metallo-beta-lactamase domain-containing protein 1 n=1 Tax=Lottia gigantea TaxID=225164 RepID=V3ZDP0_LOTGI|nr:hypothetical protein LOTGIDRAFT_237140 [Lottia gigantea]ESO82157.1 hypothetical protein LOTGIDRAFT_237140 [Lottia gigantea]